jgi:hypothetical protein
MYLQPQPGDHRAAAQAGAPPGEVQALAGGLAESEGAEPRPDHQDGRDAGAGGDGRGGDRPDGRRDRRRRGHLHHRAVPAALIQAPAGGAVLCAGGVRDAEGGRGADGAAARGERPVGALLLPRPRAVRRTALRRGGIAHRKGTIWRPALPRKVISPRRHMFNPTRAEKTARGESREPRSLCCACWKRV